MSYAVYVYTPGDSHGSTNALRFAAKDEAQRAGDELLSRWLLLTYFDVRETTDPVNYEFPPKVLLPT